MVLAWDVRFGSEDDAGRDIPSVGFILDECWDNSEFISRVGVIKDDRR